MRREQERARGYVDDILLDDGVELELEVAGGIGKCVLHCELYRTRSDAELLQRPCARP